MEAVLLEFVAWGMIVAGLATFISLTTKFKAPYGRYSGEASPWYGFPVPAKVAWVLQECPCVFATLYCIYTGKESCSFCTKFKGVHTPINCAGNEECLASWANRILLGLYLLHYI